MEGTIRTVIVEDESRSMLTLQTLLGRYCPQVEVVGTAGSVEAGVKVLAETKPDLVFMDIAMPDGDAFDLLNRIGTINFEIIFITAYNDFALKAFEFSALHYLLKPVNYRELVDAVGRYDKSRTTSTIQPRLGVLNRALTNRYDKISLPSNEGLTIVEIRDIIRFEAAGNYSTVFLAGGESLIMTKTLNQFEEILDGMNFCRIHNTHLINLQYVRKYHRGQGGSVTLGNGTVLAVSRTRKTDFLEKLKAFSLSVSQAV